MTSLTIIQQIQCEFEVEVNDTLKPSHRWTNAMVHYHCEPLKPMVKGPQNHRKTIETNGLGAGNHLMVMVE